MRFLSGHQKSTALLKSWSQSRQLYMASYFFWLSGEQMQKSQRGLLQTLLCQILRTDPDLVTSVCPNHNPNEPWGCNDLMTAFKRLTEVSSSTFLLLFLR